jgi:hypothetical protein
MVATPRHPTETPDVGSRTAIDDGAPSTATDNATRPTIRLAIRRWYGESPKAAPVRHAPLSLAATVNALWAAVWSLVPMVFIAAAVTLAGPQRPPVLQVVRYGLAAWLLGHGVPLRVAGQPIALIPLAVAALAAWRCVRAGRNTVRALRLRRARSVRPAVVIAVSVAIPYGLLGIAAAALARSRALDVAPIRAGATLGVFALVTAFLGAWPDSGFARRFRARVPYVVRGGVRTAVVAVALLLVAGALAVGVEIAVAGATATQMLENMHLGFAGDAGIVLVCLAYAPNLAVWASAFLAGPGFTLGQVPELPVFAGLPDRAVTGIGQALLATPLLAGLVAGVLLGRRARQANARENPRRANARDNPRRAARHENARRADGHENARRANSREYAGQAAARENAPERIGRGALAAAAAIAGPLAAVLLGIVGVVASGALGGDALVHTGEVGWEFAIIGGLGIGIGVAAGALIAAGDSAAGG